MPNDVWARQGVGCRARAALEAARFPVRSLLACVAPATPPQPVCELSTCVQQPVCSNLWFIPTHLNVDVQRVLHADGDRDQGPCQPQPHHLGCGQPLGARSSQPLFWLCPASTLPVPVAGTSSRMTARSVCRAAMHTRHAGRAGQDGHGRDPGPAGQHPGERECLDDRAHDARGQPGQRR